MTALTEPSAAAERRTVLIVDDDIALHHLLARMVSRMGFATITAANGHDAINVVRGSPDLACMVLDLVLPNMGGAEIAAAVQRIAPELPIILMSGYALPRDIASIPNQSVVGFLVKPFSSDDLRRLIHQAVASNGPVA